MTDCRKCLTYQRLGEECPIIHGKQYYWDYCRSYKPLIPSKKPRGKMWMVKAR